MVDLKIYTYLCMLYARELTQPDPLNFVSHPLEAQKATDLPSLFPTLLSSGNEPVMDSQVLYHQRPVCKV